MKNLWFIAYVIGFATDLIERGATILEVKELMEHSNIRSSMEYIHAAKIELTVKNPLDAFIKGELKEDGSIHIK